MIIYKFRSLTEPNREEAIKRICQIVLEKKTWCSSVDVLNDPDEFKPKPICTGSDEELKYLGLVWAKTKGITDPIEVKTLKRIFNNHTAVKALADPILTKMCDECRNSEGLSCFSMVDNEPELWDKYAGQGNGVCISIEVPDNLVGSEYRKVQYVVQKKLPLVLLLKAYMHYECSEDAFYRVLITKTKKWEREAEIRFISKLQNVNATMNCQIKAVRFGSKVCNQDKSALCQMIDRVNPTIEVSNYA
jgi:hypothetical protein